MKTFRFLDFPVYNKSKLFYHKILSIKIKIRDQYIRDQLLRATFSVILNIAEGSAKRSDKDFARYLEISIGSLNETIACLDVLHERKIIATNEFSELVDESEVIARQLGGFIKKLRISS